ncbi:MAG: thiamine pyrophosphate-binding protein [Alphaproteobacteria bacterium]|nr:thiamine pyrophosphate-binding protein [Alphaproteobacteria bacterium]
MRGRQVLMQSLVAHGVDSIFGNPGTTESPLIDSLAEFPQLAYYVALHEGVALGAASYYAQASGKPAMVNLHVAPGLGNAIGMLYSAMKANSPLLVTAGQQDTRMRLRAPVLSHDLVAMAAPVCKWSVQVERADEFAPILARALKLAQDPPSGPVFVGLPIDVMEQETEVAPAPPSPLHRAGAADARGIEQLAGLLLASERPAVVAGDDVARAGAGEALLRLVERTGAAVWWEGLRARASFPTGHANARGALPFDAAAIAKALGDADCVLLLGGPFFEEVWFTPGSPFPPGVKVAQIEEAPERLAGNFPLAVGLAGSLAGTLAGVAGAIERRADARYRAAAARRNAAHRLASEAEAAAQTARLQKNWDRQPMSMARAMAEIRAGAPADAIVVEEAITASADLAKTFRFDTPDSYFSGRGGGIGQGLAGALGIKVAHRARPVLAISGDGSAMYSIQALWTAAHHDLAIVFVVLVNREYRVLKHNLDTYRQRFATRSNRPYAHMDLARPALDFVALAAGMGVAGTRVEKADALAGAIARAVASGRPHLVEVVLEAKR